MLNSLQENFRNHQIKFEDQTKQLKEEIKMELDVSNSLRLDLDSKENQIKKLERAVKEVANVLHVYVLYLL